MKQRRRIDDARLRKLHAQGLDAQAIADAMGFTRQAVYNRAAVLHLPMPRASRAGSIDRRALRLAWTNGTTIVEIAAQLGCSRQAVSKVAVELGLPPRAPRKTSRFDMKRAWQMRDEGNKNADIAAAFGLTVEYVTERLRTEPRPAPATDGAGCPAMPRHPFWTPARDALIWDAAGRYAALANLSAALGKPIAEVQRRWHQLRATA